MKKYSIIIPTLNEESGISDFLKSLQSLRSQCEIIIADGGSTDKTKKLALPYVDVFLTAKKGRAIQMNDGAKQASSATLIFLHADTFLPKLALQSIEEGMNKGYQWGRFNMQLIGQHSFLKVISFMMNWRSKISGIATGDQAIFIQKSLFDELGGYPEIALMEDIALSKQLKKHSAPYCIKQAVKSSARRWESFGLARMVLLMWYLRLRYFLGTSPDRLVELYRRGRFV
ncbi:MAG: TIGR04283 family arsenosugar biosynthesis glycosyltransferase [Methyloprofundus sp.]|nr:TIGR04283 family arsenosugar biosynthesis glycosyltransferase [Methyloprofundus sp.]